MPYAISVFVLYSVCQSLKIAVDHMPICLFRGLWMDQRLTLGFGIGGRRLIQVQYTSGSLVAIGRFWALTLRLCLIRRAEIEDGLVVESPGDLVP
jgi:hypothetical protein